MATRGLANLVEIEIVLQFHPHRHRVAVFNRRLESNSARSFDRSLSQPMWEFAFDLKTCHFAVLREYCAQHYCSLNTELACAIRIRWLLLFEYAHLLRNLTAGKNAIVIFHLTRAGNWS